MELTKVVGRLVPFHRTVAPDAKLFPFTVSVKAEAPAVADVGDRVVIVGAGVGLLADDIVKFSEKSEEPSQSTCMVHVPG